MTDTRKEVIIKPKIFFIFSIITKLSKNTNNVKNEESLLINLNLSESKKTISNRDLLQTSKVLPGLGRDVVNSL